MKLTDAMKEKQVGRRRTRDAYAARRDQPQIDADGERKKLLKCGPGTAEGLILERLQFYGRQTVAELAEGLILPRHVVRDCLIILCNEGLARSYADGWVAV